MESEDGEKRNQVGRRMKRGSGQQNGVPNGGLEGNFWGFIMQGSSWLQGFLLVANLGGS